MKIQKHKSRRLNFREYRRRSGNGGYKSNHPHLIRYRKEIEAYEYYYITESEAIHSGYGGTFPTPPSRSEDVKEAAKFAIENHNINQNLNLSLVEVIRSNTRLGGVYYVTLKASDGMFYETQTMKLPGTPFKVLSFRVAKHYPVGSSASETSQSFCRLYDVLPLT